MPEEPNSFHGQFRDAAVYDPEQRTAISVRDGVLEYYGHELGMEPADKVFLIYRSPATIANTAMKMQGIPITDEHVSLDMPAPSDGGFVNEAEMVDAHDPHTTTTIAIRNRLTLADTVAEMVDAGRRELSLGYGADLVPHDEYDFEQVDIQPHHLATVDSGRCGQMCSFLDRKQPETDEGDPDVDKTKLHKAFCDANGEMNLQQIIELATALPEAIKAVPVDQLQQLTEPLAAIVEASKAQGITTENEPEPSEGEPQEEEMTDMNGEEEEKKFADAVDKKAKEFMDAAIKRHAETIEKARDFLPGDYRFADKSTEQIMRDALATEHDDAHSFADNDLPLAFRMLKKQESAYKEFGDKNPNDFASIADKDIG